MIKPSITELLSGVARSLRERVLPEIPPGTTRRQIQAAVGIISRVALVWDKTGPYLYTDNEDIVDTLRQILPILERVAAQEGAARIKPVCGKLRETLDQSTRTADGYPRIEALSAYNLDLQELLTEIQEALHENPAESADRDQIKSMLHALFRRMVARELEITQPVRR